MANPNWKKGVSGNPNGRPKKPEIEQLRTALQRAKVKDNFDLLEHFIKRAKVSDQVLIALAKKVLPDMKQADVNVNKGCGVTFVRCNDNNNEG